MKETLGFDDFIAAVDGGCREFVTGLHRSLMEMGCKLEVKEAKSGFVASYLLNKKTIANYVFRKKGLIARIYPNHLPQYLEVLDAMPNALAAAVLAAPDCKRLLDPAACNPKCPMGYDFPLRGLRAQKCRNSAFQFLVCRENNPFIEALVLSEARAGAPA